VATSTVENYLKTLFTEQQCRGGDLVPMGALATAMRVAPGTVTAMVKTLAESGLADYEPRGGVKLSSKGERLALHVLRRHRLVEQFLVEVLKLDWSEVDQEAEELEHAISDKVLERIDAILGRPRVDPHGDPIPSAKGKLAEPRHGSLLNVETGARMRVARVIDQNPAFLQFINRCGLTPGTILTIESRDPLAAAVTVKPENHTAVTLGTDAAAKILVEGS